MLPILPVPIHPYLGFSRDKGVYIGNTVPHNKLDFNLVLGLNLFYTVVSFLVTFVIRPIFLRSRITWYPISNYGFKGESQKLLTIIFIRRKFTL